MRTIDRLKRFATSHLQGQLAFPEEILTGASLHNVPI